MADLISPKYKALLVQKHAQTKWGMDGRKWAPSIATLLNRFPAGFTVLDYGCGRGTLKKELQRLRPDADIREYDPGIPGKDTLSWECVDFITCTDVLEHVEEEMLDRTLTTLDQLAKWGVFFDISCRPAKHVLPDGRNAHLTVHPPAWWREKLDEAFREMKWRTHVESDTQFVVSGVRTWDVV